MEFRFVEDLPALFKQLAALPEFRMWSWEQLEWGIQSSKRPASARNYDPIPIRWPPDIWGSQLVPTVRFSPALYKLVKQITKLGQDAETLGRSLKVLGVSLASNDLGRMMAEFELDTKSDTPATVRRVW
jgi:hypothetical protein